LLQVFEFNVIADVLYDCFMNERSDAGTGKDEARESGADEPMLYCPVCSCRLTARKCKLFCEQCGYYMSCSDYY
jgi:hypothetical protein